MSVAKETVCFVFNGGAGATVNAGGVTKAAWDAHNHDASKFMQANGAPICSQGSGTSDACRVYEQEGGPYDGKVRVDAQSPVFGDVVAGSVAFIDFASVYDSGYYEVVSGGAYTLFVIDLEYIANTDCDIWVGGAFPGIQAASESDLMNAESYTRTCLVRGDVAQTVGVSISTGQPTVGNAMKRFIGVSDNDSWVPVPYGSYVMYDASASGGLGAAGFTFTVGGVYMFGIGQKYPSGPVPPVHRCFQGQANHVLFENCYAEGGADGFYTRGSFISCTAKNCRNTGFYVDVHGGGCYYCSVIAGEYSSYMSGFRSGGAGTVFVGCLVVGGAYGIVNLSASYSYLISNCTFIGVTGYCIDLDTYTANTGVTIRNCLFIKNGGPGVVAIKADGQWYSEDYNVADIAAANCNFHGEHSLTADDGVNFSIDSPLVDIAAGNYDINYDSLNARTYLIEKGAPINFGSGTTTRPSTIGASELFDLPAKASVLSTDTIMGLTGGYVPQVGGGGGGGHVPELAIFGN